MEGRWGQHGQKEAALKFPLKIRLFANAPFYQRWQERKRRKVAFITNKVITKQKAWPRSFMYFIFGLIYIS